MDYHYPQYGHSEAVHSQQYGVMPANPVTMGYFYPSYQPVPTFHENKVMFFNINHGISKCQEEKYLHFCAAADKNLFRPPSASRPHIQVVTDCGFLISALVDSGAELSMAKTILANKSSTQRVGKPIPILDVHSNQEMTRGQFSFKFDILESSTTTPLKDVSANVHLSDVLSSEIIFGADWLRPMGAVIHMEDNSVEFHPNLHPTVASCLKPVLSAGLAAASAIEHLSVDRQHYFTCSPKEDIDIPVCDQVTFRSRIDTFDNLIFKQGSKVVVNSGLSPDPCTVDGIYTVERDNMISLTFVNKSVTHMFLKKDRPINGLTVEPLSAYEPPVKTDKEDLICLTHHDVTVNEVKRVAAAFAAELNVTLDTTPHELDFTNRKTDGERRAKMRHSYRAALCALEQSGLPIPGSSEKPSLPPSKQVRDHLISQFAFKDVDPQYVESYRRLILENHDIFSKHKLDIGHASHYQHKIVPIPGKVPLFQKQFKIPINDEKMLSDFADEMTAAGILIPTIQNTFNTAIFSVAKQGGQGRRFIQDFRPTNQCSLEDKWTIMDVRQSLIAAGKDKPTCFSKCDCTGAYYHLSLAPESQPWTTFTLPFRQQSFMWSRCAQGLQGASASFSKLMAIIFQGIKNTLTYVDDLICMCKSHPEMLVTLQHVFTECRRHGLKLNLAKCLFGVAIIEWIGYTLSRFGISPAQTKMDFVRQLKPPDTVKAIKSQLGFFQFLAGNIEKYAWIAHPLSQLTSQNCGWVSVKKSGPLPEDAMKAWLELKRVILANPTLAFPDHSLPFMLYVDACVGKDGVRGGVAGILCQRQNNRTVPVGFFSRKMRDSENFYNPYNSELLAILRSLDHFHHIIKGARVVIYSDHNPLIIDNSKSDKTMSNLSIKIQEFQATLKHVKGSENEHADFVSRNAADKEEPAGSDPPPPVIPWTGPKTCACTVCFRGGIEKNEALTCQDLKANRVGSLQVFSAAVSSVTSEEWLTEQQQDPLCKALHTFIVSKKISKSPAFAPIIRLFGYKCFIDNSGLLFLCDGRRGQVFSKRLWVPVSMRQKVLSDAHGSLTSGHFKQEIVVGTLLQRYFWPSLAQDVEEFVTSCPECYIQQDRKARKTRTPLHPWPIPTYRNQIIYVDLIGPLKSVTANRFVLDITDAYTRWTTLVAIPNKEAFTVAAAIFDNHTLQQGPCQAIHSDNGTEFVNQVCAELYRLIEAKSHTGCSYHPHAQGLVERVHRSVAEYLRIFVDESTTNWEEFLKPLAFSLNTKIHSSTKMSPYFMTYGEHPLLPWVQGPAKKSYSESDIASKFRLLQFAHTIVNQNNLASKQANKRQYDKLAKERVFKIGDQVLVHYNDPLPGQNRKLFRQWRGPFFVMQSLGHDSYKVKKPTHRTTTVHAGRMKFYDPMNHPEDPEVLLSREDDVDVVGQDQVISEPPALPGAGPAAQVNEPEAQASAYTMPQQHQQYHSVNMNTTRHPSIGLPLVYHLWLEQKNYPPLLAFPDFV